MADEEDAECCPLCMEELDLTDKTFNACPCGYQVCLWCWHQIKNEYNGLCPACRAPYSELSKQKSPLDREDVLRRTKQRKQKEKSERRTASQSKIPAVNRRNLANVRVMQRNLVYVIGLPQHFAEDDILRSNECFGQYGKIVKAVVNKSHLNSDRMNATASAYITFANKDDALACIIAVDGYYLDGSLLRASFGTTKYCNFFLRNMSCNNPDCLYLHELGDQDDSFTKEEMQSALHSGRAAFRDLNTNEIRSGSRFPAPLKAQGESQRSAASVPTSAAPSTSTTAADRQAQSAAAIHKLRQTNNSGGFPELRRGDSYSRIVTGFAVGSSSSSSSSSPSTPPGTEIEVATPPPTTSEDRKPNLRVDTSVSRSSAPTADAIVGPLEALKLATGSSSQEPAWARPFPSPSVVHPNENDDALSSGPAPLDPVFSPFGMGFDGGIRSSNAQAHDPWGGSVSKTLSPLPDQGADSSLTSSFAESSGFPSSYTGDGVPSAGRSQGMGGLSFASIDAIFSQRNESSEAIAGMLGVQLAPQPLTHGSPSMGSAAKNASSSRFAFANQPSMHGHISSGQSPIGSSSHLPPSSPYRNLPDSSQRNSFGGYSSFRNDAAPPPLFSSAADTSAFPPLRSSAESPTLPLPSSASPFARSTSDPYPMPGLGGIGGSDTSSGLAFLQQMLPNVNISYGGEYSTPSNNSNGATWGALGSLGFDSSDATGNSGNHSAPFYDPAIVTAPGLSNFYGMNKTEDDRRVAHSPFGGSFRRSSSVMDK